MSPAAPARPEPLSPQDLAALRAHPRFRATVEAHAAETLAHYASLSRIERWAQSDLGRAALTAAAIVLDALPVGLTLGGLFEAAARTGFCSRGRVLAYLDRAIANGLIAPAQPAAKIETNTRLVMSDRFVMAMSDPLELAVRSVAVLAPETAPAIPRLEDIDVRKRMTGWIGVLTIARPELFPGAGQPVHLFQARDGGARMMEELICRQPPARARLLETCEVSHSALARASFCSRRHAERLLKDGVALGLMQVEGGRVTVSPELSADVERFFARVFAIARIAALTALADD